jgi:hypothetical protein
MALAGVPKNRQTALTKPEIAIEEIDRLIASGAFRLCACRLRVRLQRVFARPPPWRCPHCDMIPADSGKLKVPKQC